MITPDSPIVGPPSGTLADALDFAPRLAHDYLNELWRLCQIVGIDPAILAAQSAHETADWKSYWWNARLNPAGIGITGDLAQDAKSQTWESAVHAARGHFAHMMAYVRRANPTPPGQVWHGDNGWAQKTLGIEYPINLYDDRWSAVHNAGFGGTVTTIRDLTGKWATDPDYDEKIVRKHAAIFCAKEQPVAMSPKRYDLRIHYATFGLTEAEALRILDNNFAYRQQGAIQGRPEYIVYHIQDGTTKGSLDWWANGAGVQASASKMIQKDGSILTVILDGDGPWTNGDDANPTPAGQPLINLPGNSNLWTLSIEFEGDAGDMPTPEQLESAVIVTREWEATHPQLKPASRKLRHADINSVSRPNCPGNKFYAAIMAALGTTDDEPTPFPIPWKRGDLGPRKLGTQPAVAYLVELTAIKDINAYVAADPKSQRGPRVKMKDKVVSLGAVQGERNVYEIVDLGDGKPWRVARHAFTPKQLPKP